MIYFVEIKACKNVWRSFSETRDLFCVTVPPRIAPFSFNQGLSEGVRSQVTCVIEEGDPPFTILWSKDGDSISDSNVADYGGSRSGLSGKLRHIPDLKVTNIDAHSSTIIIDRVTSAHTGNYTCVVRNSVAEVRRTAELVVRGKVKHVTGQGKRNFGTRYARTLIAPLSILLLQIASLIALRTFCLRAASFVIKVTSTSAPGHDLKNNHWSNHLLIALFHKVHNDAHFFTLFFVF